MSQQLKFKRCYVPLLDIKQFLPSENLPVNVSQVMSALNTKKDRKRDPDPEYSDRIDSGSESESNESNNACSDFETSMNYYERMIEKKDRLAFLKSVEMDEVKTNFYEMKRHTKRSVKKPNIRKRKVRVDYSEEKMQNKIWKDVPEEIRVQVSSLPSGKSRRLANKTCDFSSFFTEVEE